MNEQTLTTIADLLQGYKEKDITLTTGKTFTIRSFTPGNLLLDVGSPLVERLTEASEEDLRALPLDAPNTNAGRSWSRIEQVVCDFVTSVSFSPEPQKYLPEGLVSLRLLTLTEIRELYIGIRDLSISPKELAMFRKTRGADEGSKHEELDSENSEDSGEESE